MGPGVLDLDAAGTGAFIDPAKSAHRAALAIGLNWPLNLNTVNKTEYRFDQSAQPVFLDMATGGYRKSNQWLKASVALSF
jgi:hypothetical protein